MTEHLFPLLRIGCVPHKRNNTHRRGTAAAHPKNNLCSIGRFLQGALKQQCRQFRNGLYKYFIGNMQGQQHVVTYSIIWDNKHISHLQKANTKLQHHISLVCCDDVPTRFDQHGLLQGQVCYKEIYIQYLKRRRYSIMYSIIYIQGIVTTER